LANAAAQAVFIIGLQAAADHQALLPCRRSFTAKTQKLASKPQRTRTTQTPSPAPPLGGVARQGFVAERRV